MTRSAYFDDFADIRSAVCQRLLSVTDTELPKDGSAGPLPFDIAPLEKWLFEAYVRHYKDDPNRHGAFWVGIADALEELLTTGTQNLACISRCAELLEHISNDPSIGQVNRESFVEVNRLLSRPTDSANPGVESDAIQLQTALLKIAIFTSPVGTMSSILASEEKLRAIVLFSTAVDPQPDSQLAADAICWLLRAWLHTGNRDISRRSSFVPWCISCADHLERFKYCTSAMERVVKRCAPSKSDMWAELVSAAGNTPLPVTSRRATTPRYIMKQTGRSDLPNPQHQAA